MGAAPDWYLLIRAARYLKVAPWELADRPMYWQNHALASEAAEAAQQQDKGKEGRHAHRRTARHSS